MTHGNSSGTATASAHRVILRRRPAGTLIAAGVLQAAQALLWMFVGLLVSTGDGAVRGEPVTVVLLIGAILAFCVGCFALGLAAGMFGRSDVCRVASLVFQMVFGALIIAGTIDLIWSHRAGLTISFDPETGPAFGVSTGFIVLLLSTCVAAVVLLMCRQSSWATRQR